MKSAREPKFIAALRKNVEGMVRPDDSLARWSTYRIGGPATVFRPNHSRDVAAALRAAAEHEVPWFALGLGSNLLFPDEGLDALVIRIGKGLDRLDNEGDRWIIGAGMPAPLAAKRTAAAGWGGIHKMVGVPGSVGGGVVMNAGCHGAEWRDVIKSVLVVDTDGSDQVVSAEDAGFSYRRSALGKVVVLEATVELEEASQEALVAETDELFRWRKDETPFNQPCCGSVFKNPELPADWSKGDPRTSGQFIESAGMKGDSVGEIQVSPMHANYLVNAGDGKAADVKKLMRKVQRQVKGKWGVSLEPEVKLIGSDGGVVSL